MGYGVSAANAVVSELFRRASQSMSEFPTTAVSQPRLAGDSSQAAQESSRASLPSQEPQVEPRRHKNAKELIQRIYLFCYGFFFFTEAVTTGLWGT